MQNGVTFEIPAPASYVIFGGIAAKTLYENSDALIEGAAAVVGALFRLNPLAASANPKRLASVNADEGVLAVLPVMRPKLDAEGIFNLIKASDNQFARTIREEGIDLTPDDLFSILALNGTELDEVSLELMCTKKRLAVEEKKMKVALSLQLPPSRKDEIGIEQIKKTLEQVLAINLLIKKGQSDYPQLFREQLLRPSGVQREKFLTQVVTPILNDEQPESLEKVLSINLKEKSSPQASQGVTILPVIDKVSEGEVTDRSGLLRQEERVPVLDPAEGRTKKEVKEDRTPVQKATLEQKGEEVQAPVGKQRSWDMIRKCTVVNKEDHCIKMIAKRIGLFIMIVLAPISLIFKFIVCPLVDRCRKVDAEEVKTATTR